MYRQGWNCGWKLTGLWGRSFGWQASRKVFWIYFRKMRLSSAQGSGFSFSKRADGLVLQGPFRQKSSWSPNFRQKAVGLLTKRKKDAILPIVPDEIPFCRRDIFLTKNGIGVLENVKSRFSRRDRNRISEKYCKPALRETQTALPDFSLIPIFGSNIRKRVLGGFEKAGWKSGLCLAFRRGLLRISKHPERRLRID